MDLSQRSARHVVRGLGAYMRAADAQDLPSQLRPLRGFTDKALTSPRHTAKVLGALEDEGLRARILEWIDKDNPSLPARTIEVMRVACVQTDGWVEAVEELSGEGSRRPPLEPSQDASQTIEQERARTRKARADARRVREDADKARRELRSRVESLEKEVVELRARLAEAQTHIERVNAAAEREVRQWERSFRKERTAAEKAAAGRAAAAKEVKAVRAEGAAAARRAAQLEEELAVARRAGARRREGRVRPEPRGPRRALAPPQGRFEEDPGTLEEWLEEPDVLLVVDGYNVAMSPGAFGDVSLEQQRNRVIEGLRRLGARKSIVPVVVFDGSDVPPGIAGGRRRAQVLVEYSRPGEIADDHIVRIVESHPPTPVIVVTSDRELQRRVRSLEATIATSPQLLHLIR